MPKPRVQFERAKECANRGFEMVNMAITLAPDNESAWAYKATRTPPGLDCLLKALAL